jgi:hypothetical protein
MDNLAEKEPLRTPKHLIGQQMKNKNAIIKSDQLKAEESCDESESSSEQRS